MINVFLQENELPKFLSPSIEWKKNKQLLDLKIFYLKQLMIASFNYVQSSAIGANTWAMTLFFVRKQENMESKMSKVSLESVISKWREKKQISHTEEFQTIYILRRWSTPSVWAVHSDFLSNNTVWKG